ncbi:TetR/AcrR family transcriptional regulator [Anaeromyxobacter terrae]|uniref:TetR/AcrR family transcriptional regulator n=1 Tax=Anaeromyxobacter terrae TaxID=2925406 RepID=UPI001F5886DB|nr:TetR/AcrR family transcriptional regulator [Anaeromyxobacter sp. SG22]
MDGSVATRKAGAPRAGIAERIWDAARTEFSKRGYHGARVQGIARGASCNVALIYRHWASKRALYLDILRAVWLGSANEIARLVQLGPGGPASVVAAYLDAMMKDPMGAQILIREYLDGAPFLSQLTQTDPALLEPVRRAADALAQGGAGDGLDPILAVVTVGGLAALVASSREAARPFVQEPLAPEAWRRHVFELLVNGLTPARPAAPNGSATPPADEATI